MPGFLKISRIYGIINLGIDGSIFDSDVVKGLAVLGPTAGQAVKHLEGRVIKERSLISHYSKDG